MARGSTERANVLSQRHVLGMGAIRSVAATQRNRPEFVRRELVRLWRGQCTPQYVRALYALWNSRGSSLWQGAVAPFHALWRAGVPLRQKRPKDSLHLVS